jgi:hypothetical protein
VRVARKLAGFPAIDDALRRGEVSYSKVRAMLRVATSENEVLLLEHAKLMTASQLQDSSDAAVSVMVDGMGRQPITAPTDDSAESIEAASNAACRDVGLDDLAASAAPCAVGVGGGASGAARTVASIAIVDDPDAVAASVGSGASGAASVGGSGSGAASVGGGASGAARAVASVDIVDGPDPVAASVASSQPFSDVPQRSVLDQLLDEADALREADEAAHDAASDLLDAERELGVAGTAQCPSEAASGRCEVSSLRDRAAAARTAFNCADGLVAMAQGYLRGNRPECAPIEVVVTIPATSLCADAALDPVEVGEMGQSFLPSETARRLSCDAGLVNVVEDEHGTPLSVGRRRRTIGGALKRALRKRDGMCGYPGCTNHLFLEGHHIQHWADGGETTLRNMALLCSLHHRYVHEYGYAIEIGPDQRPRFRDPHGRWVAAVPELPRVAELGWPHIRAANEALQIDAETIAGPWDGTPVDYGRIVGHLAAADGLA